MDGTNLNIHWNSNDSIGLSCSPSSQSKVTSQSQSLPVRYVPISELDKAHHQVQELHQVQKHMEERVRIAETESREIKLDLMTLLPLRIKITDAKKALNQKKHESARLFRDLARVKKNLEDASQELHTAFKQTQRLEEENLVLLQKFNKLTTENTSLNGVQQENKRLLEVIAHQKQSMSKTEKQLVTVVMERNQWQKASASGSLHSTSTSASTNTTPQDTSYEKQEGPPPLERHTSTDLYTYKKVDPKQASCTDPHKPIQPGLQPGEPGHAQYNRKVYPTPAHHIVDHDHQQSYLHYPGGSTQGASLEGRNCIQLQKLKNHQSHHHIRQQYYPGNNTHSDPELQLCTDTESDEGMFVW